MATSSASWSRRSAAFPVARGPEPGRIARGATLLQAVGAAHLVRRGGDGDWRRAVALGSTLARRRAQAGEEQARALAGGVDPYEVALSCRRRSVAGDCART